MNVMISSAGRRNYLVRWFAEAVGPDGRVIAVDASDTAPALMLTEDARTIPLAHDFGYLQSLLRDCDEHGVALIVPLNDLELPTLARHKHVFERRGTKVLVSSQEVVNICFDKKATNEFLAAQGLRTPKTFVSLDAAGDAVCAGKLHYPLVLKPRWGTASIGVVEVHDQNELRHAWALLEGQIARSIIAHEGISDPAHRILIQEKISGIEYGLDVINDLAGGYATTLVKRKIAMRAGETDKAETVQSPRLEEVGATIGRTLRHIGILDCDVFVDERGPVVLEMNARFGGGYPFSHLAGAHLPRAIIAWATGNSPNPSWLTVRPGVVGAKFDELIQVSGRVRMSAAGRFRRLAEA